MSETLLGQVTVSDSNNHQAIGSGAQDGKQIVVRLGNQPWIQKGGNYTLATPGNVWKAMCIGGPDTSDYYSFVVY